MITSNKERASPCSHRSTPCSQHCCLELELLIESLKGLTTRELELLISMWGRLPTCWQGSTSWSKLLLAAPLHCSTTAQTRRKLSQEAPSFMVQLGSPRAVTGRTQSDWRGRRGGVKGALNCRSLPTKLLISSKATLSRKKEEGLFVVNQRGGMKKCDLLRPEKIKNAGSIHEINTAGL